MSGKKGAGWGRGGGETSGVGLGQLGFVEWGSNGGFEEDQGVSWWDEREAGGLRWRVGKEPGSAG